MKSVCARFINLINARTMEAKQLDVYPPCGLRSNLNLLLFLALKMKSTY